MSGPLPLFDCRLDEAARRAVEPVLASGQLAAGPFVSELEHSLSERLGGRRVVAMSDMSQALALAMRLGGIGAGDDVLTLAVNCMSSNSAIAMVGANPIWVDLDPETATVNLQDARAALTPRTRALVAYHLAGYPADIVALERFCAEHGLLFIEDANNALGATWAGRPIGSVGDFSVFSFYANRQVNGIEGAALACADDDLAERARKLRRFGIDANSFRDGDGEIAVGTDVEEIGVSAAMNNVNARLACHSLETLDERLGRNRRNAALLTDMLSGSAALRPVTWSDKARPVFWVFLIRANERDRLMRSLKAQGVQCSKLHQRNDGYSGFGSPNRRLSGTAAFEDEMLALPCGWWLEEDQIRAVASAVRACADQ